LDQLDLQAQLLQLQGQPVLKVLLDQLVLQAQQVPHQQLQDQLELLAQQVRKVLQ
jgi:hypothetical protein